MPPKPPVVLAKKGLINLDPDAVKQNQHPGKQNNQQPKNAVRLKICLRRLPPALSKDEFVQILGDEWKVPGDKIDWLDYHPGKTKAPGKLSVQSRAYLHLTKAEHIKAFETKFLSLNFQDAKGSYKDAQLKHLLPSLDYALNQRIPAQKQRVDGRQGTIDQDPEFIAFLERETQPVAKPLSLDQALAQEKAKDKVSSTPLLDDLREKKQNKARANAKHKEEKQSEKSSARNRDHKSDAKQPVKVLAKNQKKQPAQSSAPASPAVSAPASGRKRERERATPNAIKTMLQRDLGLTQPSSKRGAKDAAPASTSKTTSPAPAADAAPAAKSSKSRSGRNKDKSAAQATAQENPKPASPAPTGILKKPAQQPTPKGPKAKGNAADAASPAPSSAPSNKQSKANNSSSNTTKAYLKHANASQGVTEPLLLTALSAFGPVVKVEIDKRKGTALAEFKDNDGLKAAMAKKSVPVAQGAVEVLEFRDKPAQGGRGGQAGARSGGGGGGGGGSGGNTPNRGRGGRARGGAAANAATNGPAATANGKPDAT